MKRCKYEKWLIDMIGKNASDKIGVACQNHLKTCSLCKERINEFRELGELLSRRERPELSRNFLNVYQRNLKTIFPSQSIFQKIRDTLLSFNFSPFQSRSPVVRWTCAVCILVIGIAIGKFLLTPDLLKRQTVVPPNVLVLSLTSDEIKLLSDYFVESEMLILSLVNWNETTASDMDYLKECAKNILACTPLVENEVKKVNDESLDQFVNQLEVILLDFTNVGTENTPDIIRFIQESVKETNLSYESNRWQKVLNDLQPDNI